MPTVGASHSGRASVSRPSTTSNAATVRAIGQAELRDWHERWYRPSNLVVSAAGDVEHEALAAPFPDPATSARHWHGR